MRGARAAVLTELAVDAMEAHPPTGIAPDDAEPVGDGTHAGDTFGALERSVGVRMVAVDDGRGSLRHPDESGAVERGGQVDGLVDRDPLHRVVTDHDRDG